MTTGKSQRTGLRDRARAAKTDDSQKVTGGPKRVSTSDDRNREYQKILEEFRQSRPDNLLEALRVSRR